MEAQARGKLLELLHYAPDKCEPRPEVVERIDRGDHVCERVLFNTTPDVRVPAYVLVPKKADRPLPAVVALHDHGGFYLWGKEKLVETDDEHPVLTAFKKRYYAGTSTATALVKQGYVVAVIDMFYWGERRLLLDGDPDDWRKRPKDITAGAGRRVQPAGVAERAARRPDHLRGRVHLAGGDVLGRRPDGGLPAHPAGGGPEARSAAWACRWAGCGRATWPRWTTGSRRPSSSAG